MPITWRNVESDTTRGAAQLMEVARRSFNDGFGNLQSTLDQRNQIQDQNWDAQKQANTNAFLDRLAQFKTPEELAAAQQSGELQALRQQFGGQVDSAAIRSAEANAQQQLIERITQQNQYQDDTRLRGERGIRDELLGKLYAGDVAGFNAGLAQHDLLNEAELAKQGYVHQKDLRGEKREDTRLGYEGARVRLAQNAEARAASEFNDRRQQVLLSRSNDAAVAQALQGATSHADAMARYNRWADEQKLPASLRTAGAGALGQGYQVLTGLTPEQDAAVSGSVADLERSAQLAEEHAKGFAVFSNPDVKNMREEEAMASILPRVKGEEDNTLRNIQMRVEQFRKKNGIKDDVNLGPVIYAVLQNTGLDEAMFGDDTLDMKNFDAKLAKTYQSFLDSEQADIAARNARKLVDTTKTQERNKFLKLNISNNLK